MDNQQYDQYEGEERIRMMESLEQQMMNEELEAERMKMQEERANRFKGAKSRDRRRTSDPGVGQRCKASFPDYQQVEGIAVGEEQDTHTRGKEADKDMNRRLSLPFGSLGQDEGRLLRKPSIYPSVKSLVDAVPALIPYAASQKDMDTSTSVYTATTCAETNTYSDSASSINAFSRQSGSNASLMFDSFGEMSGTNHSSSTIGTNRGIFDSDGSSFASSGRYYGGRDGYHPSRRSYSQPYAHVRRPENYAPASDPRPRARNDSAPERDFTRESYYHSSSQGYPDGDTGGSPLYGSARCSQRLDEEDLEDGKTKAMHDRPLLQDQSMHDHSLNVEDLLPRNPQQRSPVPRRERERMPRSIPDLSPCHERASRSIPNLSPCHERPDRATPQSRLIPNLSPNRERLEWSSRSPARRPLPIGQDRSSTRSMINLSPSHERPERSTRSLVERSSVASRGSPGSSYKKRRGPRHPPDRDRIHLGDSLDESSHNISSESSATKSIDDGAMANSMPCIDGRNQGSGSSGESSPRSRNTYPFDQYTHRRYRHRHRHARELAGVGGRSLPESAFGYHIQRSQERQSSSSSGRGGNRRAEDTTGPSDIPGPHSRSGRRDNHFAEDTAGPAPPLECHSGSRNSQRSYPPVPVMDHSGSRSLSRQHSDSISSLSSILPLGHNSIRCGRSSSNSYLQRGELIHPLPPPTSSMVSPRQPIDDQHVAYIEIGPDEKAALRGPDATRAAIVNDFYVPKVCFGCSLDQFCIKDVLYFVCPVCKVVSPMGESDDESDHSRRRQHGVCYGFTFDTLFEMQTEIMKDDSSQSSEVQNAF